MGRAKGKKKGLSDFNIPSITEVPREKKLGGCGDELRFVTCQVCGHEQPDMGRNVLCEGCGEVVMPWYDEYGDLNE